MKDAVFSLSHLYHQNVLCVYQNGLKGVCAPFKSAKSIWMSQILNIFNGRMCIFTCHTNINHLRRTCRLWGRTFLILLYIYMCTRHHTYSGFQRGISTCLKIDDIAISNGINGFNLLSGAVILETIHQGMYNNRWLFGNCITSNFPYWVWESHMPPLDKTILLCWVRKRESI